MFPALVETLSLGVAPVEPVTLQYVFPGTITLGNSIGSILPVVDYESSAFLVRPDEVCANFTVATGSLVNGLMLNATTGELSGTPIGPVSDTAKWSIGKKKRRDKKKRQEETEDGNPRVQGLVG